MLAHLKCAKQLSSTPGSMWYLLNLAVTLVCWHEGGGCEVGDPVEILIELSSSRHPAVHLCS